MNFLLFVYLNLRASDLLLLAFGGLMRRASLPVKFESSPLHRREDLFELKQNEIVIWVLIKLQAGDIVIDIY